MLFTHSPCQLLQLLHCGGLLSLWLKYISIRGWNIFIVKYCVTLNNDQMDGSLASPRLPTKAELDKNDDSPRLDLISVSEIIK